VVQEVQKQVPNAEVTAYGNGFQVMAPLSKSVVLRKRRITVEEDSSGQCRLKHMKESNGMWGSCCDKNIPPNGKEYANLDEVIDNLDKVIAFINEVFY
jgi:hypothetical protein